MIPSREKDFDAIRLANYRMTAKYERSFWDLFGPLVRGWSLDKKRDKRFLYPNGGSCIYADMAGGRIDAYVMKEEPRIEIDPGYHMVKRAGCQIVYVNPFNGSFIDYKFDPDKTNESVGIFLATSTAELRDRFIEYLMSCLKSS